MTTSHPQLEELVAVLARLRAPGGCAWDAEQTHESLVRYLVEETHELIEAIEAGGRAELIEELGDVLYQVLFHADIAAHDPVDPFTIDDVAAHMTAKMVGRHPHVFGDAGVKTADEVAAVWDDLKRVEKPHRTSTLDGVPQGMPALALADKLVGKAKALGVTVAGESAATPAVGLGATADASTEEELGAGLLAIVARARLAGLDPERALRGALRGLQEDIRAAESVAD
ncbi:MazG family protein [Galbitalea soli]|uniref:MazG family protein n=1 Tax=Galbitalea soli TaxID=1268042 RepID=A0A7C9PM75_9MICO|nr:MazG family protein [Galbitalea soli]NEM90705.1 MazG family protein [Galbitalea soli]NYJ31423.1 XTP/dITP diphosphohydrolase [Galbitalea soli]